MKEKKKKDGGTCPRTFSPTSAPELSLQVLSENIKCSKIAFLDFSNTVWISFYLIPKNPTNIF